LGIIYASFGIPRTEWVIYMGPLEFKELRILDELLDFPRSNFLCSTLVLIHVKKSIEPQTTAKNGIFVFCSIVGMFFYLLS